MHNRRPIVPLITLIAGAFIVGVPALMLADVFDDEDGRPRE